MNDTLHKILSKSLELEVGGDIDSKSRTDFIKDVHDVKDAIEKLYCVTSNQQPRCLLLLESNSDAYTFIFSCLTLGICYAPVRPDSSVDKLSSIIKSFKPHFIVSNSSNLEIEDDIYLKCDFSLLNNCFIYVAQNVQSLENVYSMLAYVIFTSGSTGKPKGVLISRSSLAHYLEWIRTDLSFTSDNVILQTAEISFDLSVIGLFGAFISGSTLKTFINGDQAIVPTDFINKNKVNTIVCVPSFASMISIFPGISHLQCPQTFIFCGEILKASLADTIFNADRSNQIVNLYGPTEATVSCTVLKLNVDNIDNYKHKNAIAIGQPIVNHKLISEQRNGVNELFIEGVQVAEGYLGLPDKTKSSFYISKNKGYRTGDIVLTHEGNMFVLGRIDSQLKVNGYRVEAQEIEAFALTSGAKEVLVISSQNSLEVHMSGIKPDCIDLISSSFKQSFHSGLNLNLYFTQDDFLPRSNNGKLQPIKEIKQSSEVSKLQQLFIDCLGVSASSDFLELSIHNTYEWDSFSHVSLLAKLSDVYKIDISPGQLYELTSFKKISDFIK